MLSWKLGAGCTRKCDDELRIDLLLNFGSYFCKYRPHKAVEPRASKLVCQHTLARSARVDELLEPNRGSFAAIGIVQTLRKLCCTQRG